MQTDFWLGVGAGAVLAWLLGRGIGWLICFAVLAASSVSWAATYTVNWSADNWGSCQAWAGGCGPFGNYASSGTCAATAPGSGQWVDLSHLNYSYACGGGVSSLEFASGSDLGFTYTGQTTLAVNWHYNGSGFVQTLSASGGPSATNYWGGWSYTNQTQKQLVATFFTNNAVAGQRVLNPGEGYSWTVTNSTAFDAKLWVSEPGSDAIVNVTGTTGANPVSVATNNWSEGLIYGPPWTPSIHSATNAVNTPLTNAAVAAAATIDAIAAAAATTAEAGSNQTAKVLAVLGSNSVSTATNSYSASSNALTVSNLWSAVAYAPTGFLGGTIATNAHPELWAFSVRTNIGGTSGKIDLDPRKTSIWGIRLWVRALCLWMLCLWAVHSNIESFREAMDLVLHTPGTGRSSVVGMFVSVVLVFPVAVMAVLGSIGSVAAAVNSVIGSSLDSYWLPVASSFVTAYAGAWANHILEAISLVNAWIPLVEGPPIIILVWASRATMRGLGYVAAVLIRFSL